MVGRNIEQPGLKFGPVKSVPIPLRRNGLLLGSGRNMVPLPEIATSIAREIGTAPIKFAMVPMNGRWKDFSAISQEMRRLRDLRIRIRITESTN